MKYARALLGFASALLLLSGCSEKGSLEENTIKTADMSKREKAVIGQASEFYFLYNFAVDETFDSLSIWVESYENGKKSEAVYGPVTTELQGKDGYIFFSKNKEPEQAEESLFNLGMGDEGGDSSAHYTADAAKVDFAHMKQDFAEEGISIEGKNILGVYASTEDNSLTSISLDMERDAEEQLEGLEGYESVYVFMAEFKK